MFSWCEENCSRLPFTWPVNSQEDAGGGFRWRSGNHRRQVTTFVTWNCHTMNTRRRFFYSQPWGPTRSHVFIFVREGHLCKATPVNNVIFNRLLFFSVCINLGLFCCLHSRSVTLFNKTCDIISSVALQRQRRGVSLSLHPYASRQRVGRNGDRLYSGRGRFGKKKLHTLLLNELKKRLSISNRGPSSLHQQCVSGYFPHLSWCYETSRNHLSSLGSRGATPDGRLNQILSCIRISTWDALELLISSLLTRERGGEKKPSLRSSAAAVSGDQ